MSMKKTPEVYLNVADVVERKNNQGQLKIYLGASPGVGKTYQMLSDALGLRSKGFDVVIGAIETHGREEVESLASAFEKVPLKMVNTHQAVLYALNIEEVLKRAPGLVLVDEAAFNNPMGLRHPKRWQDIIELLEHGIDVYTTLNIQHLESLNDVVSSIIGIPVYETVPDAFLERADAIELIDLPSEDLILRLKQGKVYLPSEVSMAIHHFFKKKNLDALRELALRIVAERVGSQVDNDYSRSLSARLMYKQEALLVCVKNNANMPKLIRSAKRLAVRLKCVWYALYVDSGNKKDFFEVQAYLQLAESLGAKTQMVFSTKILNAIQAFIETKKITQVVIGKSKNTFWSQISRFELMVNRMSDVGIYRIELGQEGQKIGQKKPWSKLLNWLWGGGLALVLVATNAHFQILNRWYIMWLIAIGGLGIAAIGEWSKVFILTSLFLGLDLLLNEHSFSLLLSSWQEWLDQYGRWSVLFLLMSASLVYGRQKLEKAGVLERNNGFLMGFYQAISSVRGHKNILKAAYDYLTDQLQLNCLVFLPVSQSLKLFLPQHMPNPLDDKEMAIVQWVYESGQPAGHATGNLIFSQATFLPLKGAEKCMGVMRFENENGQNLSEFQKKNLLICLQQLANILDVEMQHEQSKMRDLLDIKNQVRDHLLKGFALQLYKPFVHLLKLIPQQLMTSPYAQLLERLSNHLKVMTYFSDESLLQQRSLQNMQEMIQNVLNRYVDEWGQWPVTWYVDASLPKVPVQLDLMTVVIENLLDNIHQHSNAKEGVEIGIYKKNSHLLVSIADFGPGFSQSELTKVFDSFYQGNTPTAADGLGLGLALCERIISWHNGRIWAENRQPRGMIFNFLLPLEKQSAKRDNNAQ